MDTALVTDNMATARLQARIEELTQEQQQQKREFKNIRQTQVRLEREKRAKAEELAALQRKCDELQRLKFGGPINLEAMEARGVNEVRWRCRWRLGRWSVPMGCLVHFFRRP